MAFHPRFRPGKPKKCWCGSGKKQKNCHPDRGKPDAQTDVVHNTRLAGESKAMPPLSQKPWGVPGEEHQLWVVPVLKGQAPPSNAEGNPGDYKVQMLLARPGYPYAGEREHKFIDDIVGDSHLLMAKPKAERTVTDVEKVLLQANGEGRRVTFVGLPNDKGYLGKLTVEKIHAASFNDAQTMAYKVLSPFLSAWSLHLDIPVHVETIQVTELSTFVSSLRVHTPQFEMTFSGGLTPVLSDDFCQYASIYREGMNTNSAFYRFLCFYKVIESIPHRRSRQREAAKHAGQDIPRFTEGVPTDSEGIVSLLKSVYPWRQAWDTFAVAQIVPAEVMGKKFGWIRENQLNAIRTGIAHALLKTGEITISLDNLAHIHQVNKWLPLARVMARVMLRNEFPREFEMAMTPLFVNVANS
jgi:hypothetical protein